MLELVFTSAKSGLIPGRSGFCSVAWTEGMPQNLVTLLENMSGYSVLYPPSDPRSADNPVVFSYQKVLYGQSELRILSRIAFAGLDHTGRSNKIAHHIILENDAEWIALQHGPVSAFLCEENFYSSWNEPPRLLPRRKYLKSAMTTGIKAEKWQNITGCAQWAGVIADRFVSRNDKSCLYLEYDLEAHGKNILYLIDEITRLLPPEEAREFTFNTYFSSVSNNANCFFRAALPNCQALPAIKRFRADELISLKTPPPLPAGITESATVAMAVSGQNPVCEKNTAMPRIQPLQLRKNSSEEKASRPRQELINHNKEIKTIDQPFFIEQVNKEDSSRSRLIIFSATAFLLFAVIIASILLFCWSPEETAYSSNDGHTLPAGESQKNIRKNPEKNINKKNPPSFTAEKPEINTVNKSAGKIENKNENNGRKKNENETTVKTGKKAADKPTAKIEAKIETKTTTPPHKKQLPKTTVKTLTIPEKLGLLKGFVSGTRQSGVEITLPDKLKKVTSITLTMKKSWGNGKFSDPAKFIKAEAPLKYRIYPAKKNGNAKYLPDWQSKENMLVAIKQGKLCIDDRSCKGTLSPQKEDIHSIQFFCGNTCYIWEITFADELLASIQYGTFSLEKGKLKYEYSEEEKIFSKKFLSIEDKSGELTKLKDDWEDSLKKLQNASGKVENKVTWREAQTTLHKNIEKFYHSANHLDNICTTLLYLDDESKIPEFLKKQFLKLGEQIKKTQADIKKNKMEDSFEKDVEELKYRQALYAKVVVKNKKTDYIKSSHDWLQHLLEKLEKNKILKKSDAYKNVKKNISAFNSKRKKFKALLRKESLCLKKHETLYLKIKVVFPDTPKTEPVSDISLTKAANKTKKEHVVRKWKKAD